MKLSYLIPVVVYYVMIALAWSNMPDTIATGQTTSLNFTTLQDNSSGFSESEIDTGGFFTGIIGIGTSISRFMAFAFAGIGLPVDTPPWASSLFSGWSIVFTFIAIALIVSAFWDG